MWIDDLERDIGKKRIGTHWENCHLVHKDCAILHLIALARAGRELAEAVDMQDRNWRGAPIVARALAAFREAEGGE